MAIPVERIIGFPFWAACSNKGKLVKSAPLGATVAGVGESLTGMGGEYFGRKAAGQENDFSEVALEGIGGKDVITGKSLTSGKSSSLIIFICFTLFGI